MSYDNEPTCGKIHGKPTVAVAEELLKQNAFWNGGVFAFRLRLDEHNTPVYLTDSLRIYGTLQ